MGVRREIAVKKTVKLGFCPIGKFVFSHEDAMRGKGQLEQKLKEWDVTYVGIDDAVPDGMVRDLEHVGPVVEHLKHEDVDAVFMPHCNFGTEHAVGLIGRDLDVPVLLWGPRDEAPLHDGTRLRDTLCGLFASTKVLNKLRVPFSYIENCRVEEPALRQGVGRFLGAVNAANALRSGLRIGHIGQRIDFFWTTIVNESELLDRFRIEVLPLDMVAFIRAVKARVKNGRSEYGKQVKALRAECEVEGLDEDEPLMNILAVRDQTLALVEEHGLDGVAVQDFMSLVDELGAYCFHADGMIAETCPVGYESDVLGTVSNILLERAALGNGPAFLADLTTRHPDNDNAVLVWHCGAPPSMRDPTERVRLGQHWILPSPLSGMPHFKLKDGPLTVARFDGERGEYKLAVGEGHTTDGPKTLNNYLWMETANWPDWERKLMEGPFMHHAGMVYGHYADALGEACKYVPGLEPVRLG